MQLVKPDQGTHWYKRDGQPAYGATLREARKQDLLPSVTTVLGVLAQPGLEAWKQEQAVLAALTLPRVDGEGLDEFAKRVIADSREYSKNAAAKGDELHAVMEAHLKGAPWAIEAELRPVAQLLVEWLDEHIEAVEFTEACAVSSLGFGGRIDAYVQIAGHMYLLDGKSQFVRGKSPRVYSKWGYQLGAYSLMDTVIVDGEPTRMNFSTAGVANLVFNTDAENPGVWFKEQTDVEQLRNAFVHIFHTYCYEKNYWPNGTEAVA